MNKTIEKQKKILIVDDHPIVRRGLMDMFRGEEGLEICGEASGASEAITLVESKQPDLVLLDLSLAEGSGLELIKQLKAQHPHLSILVVSIHSETQFADRAIKAGAHGYINKSDAISNIVEAAKHVLNGNIYRHAEASDWSFHSEDIVSQHRDSDLESLTDREIEVLQLVGEGLGTRKIADKLNVSIKTIETHRANIKKKLHLKDANELTEFAVRWMVENNQ